MADKEDPLQDIEFYLEGIRDYMERIAMSLEALTEQLGSIEFILSNQVHVEAEAPGSTTIISSSPEVDPNLERAVMMYGENVKKVWEKDGARDFLLWAMTQGYGRDRIIVGKDRVAADTQIKQRYDHR
jgi:hypothetical protein